MSKVIAVLGAGTGLGVAVARRFGQEGFKVALVARRLDRLNELVAELAADGVEAASFGADLADPDTVPDLIAQIRDHFGRIDAIEYGPISGEQQFVPAETLDLKTLRRLTPLLFYTPIEVVRLMLPEWRERGDGAFLLSQGISAAQPMPQFSGLGPVMAATRNYLYSLNAELAGTGIYAGALTIASLIDRSEVTAAVQDGFESVDGGLRFPLVDPDELAARYWDMYTRRDRVEQFYPEPGT